MGLDNTEIVRKVFITLFIEVNEYGAESCPDFFIDEWPDPESLATALTILPKLLTGLLKYEPAHSEQFQWVKDVNKYANRYMARKPFATSDIKRLCKRSRDLLYWNGFREAAYDRIVALQTAAGAGEPKPYAAREAKDDLLEFQEIKTFIASSAPAAMVRRGDVYRLAGLYFFAAYCYEAAHAAAPKLLGLREEIGLAYHAMKKDAKAETWLKSALKIEGSLSVYALRALGNILSNNRSLSEAEEVYKIGLKLGYVAVCRPDLVKVLGLQGRQAEARPYLEQACRDGKYESARLADAYKPFLELGQLCVKLGDIEAAESAFRSAVADNDRNALIELAELLELKGQYVEAVECRTEFSERSAATKSKRRRRR